VSESPIVTVTLNPSVDRVLEAPRFAIGENVRGKVVARYPAGKGVVVSRVLATLGSRSIATGLIGTEELAYFEQFLERQGEGRIITQFLVVRGSTRENITIVDPVEDTETHVREWGFEVQPEDVDRISSKVGLLAHRGAMMVFSGSIPPGVSPDRYVEMVRSCRARGARVVVDSSGLALEAFRGEKLWMLKINARELAEFSGCDTRDEGELVKAARMLTMEAGGPVEHMVVTFGAEGALLLSPEAKLRGRVMVHPGRIASTVGCGDALLAGLLHGGRRTGDWNAAFREGLAAATANALGRQAGLIKLDDVNEFRGGCFIDEVELPKLDVEPEETASEPGEGR
jgi:1-phosphofructokinase family hexose kinase